MGLKTQTPSARAHELWKTTCFEAFLSGRDGESYHEINLAPDGRWNVYFFDRYRNPQPPREAMGWRLTQFECAPGLLRATLELPEAVLSSPTRFGLTAVLETQNPRGAPSLSYWALVHAGDQPDFHDARSWTGLT